MLDHDVKRLALRIMRALDTPLSQKISMLIEGGEWEQVVRCTVDPRQYEPVHLGPKVMQDQSIKKCVDRLRRDAQAVSFLRKFNGDAGIDKEAATLETFLAAEVQCFQTNIRLRRLYCPDRAHSALEQKAVELLEKARAFLSQSLGNCPSPEELIPRFGPGGTYESRNWESRIPLTIYKKLVNKPAATTKFVQSGLLDMFFKGTAFELSWGERLSEVVATTSSDYLTYAPKSATTHRGICPNPGANLVAQKAVGEAMKGVLRYLGLELKPKSGLDVDAWIRADVGRLPGHAVKRHPRARSVTRFLRLGNGGQKLHQNLARNSSITGESATIDLKSASDTVAYELVRVLFPADWFSLLDTLRTTFTDVPHEATFPKGKKPVMRRHLLEKFSAMGNGFTFELETLTFASLAHAVGCKIGVDTFVYGDDLIVPAEKAADLIALLQYCGFTPNESKTYLDGYFRESCGGDYFLGHDVRPYFLKGAPSEPSHWIAVANSIRRIAVNWGLAELEPCRQFCIDRIPKSSRHYGPEELGDLCIHDEPDMWSTRVRNSIRYIKVWKPLPSKITLPSRERKVAIYKWDSTEQCYKQHLSRVKDVQARYECIALSSVLLGFPVESGLTPRGDISGYKSGWVPFS